MPGLRDNALPASGSTSWYAHYTAVDNDARALAGAVQIDSFSGADDNAKFGNALTYAAAETNKPTLQFPARVFGPLTTTRSLYSGLRLKGPFGNRGCKNLEISSGTLVNHRVTVNTGTATSSLFNGTGTNYDIVFDDIAWQDVGSSQLLHQASGTLYACLFHSQTIFGFTYAFGTPAAKCLVTQVIFSGHWTAVGFSNTQFTLGGSDCSLWMGGYLNIGGPSGGAGKPMIICDSLAKTAVGYIYSTNQNDWLGLQVKGSVTYDTRYFGGSYEGVSVGTPATRAAIDIQGGTVTMFSPFLGHVDSASVNGVITQSGGDLTLYNPVYERATAAAATFPLLYQTGGTAQVYYPKSNTSGEQIRIRNSNAVTTTIALPSNVNVG